MALLQDDTLCLVSLAIKKQQHNGPIHRCNMNRSMAPVSVRPILNWAQD